MNRKNQKLLLFAASSLGAVLLLLQQSTAVEQFVANAREAGGYRADTTAANSLQNWARHVFNQEEGPRDKAAAYIQDEARKRYIAPVDAKIDRVWKAIPGYNGLEVDIEKSLAAAEAQGYPANPPLVYREVPPAVALEQLGPHPVYKGNPNKPLVALMINVAWGDEYLPKMLATLEKEGVRATFFLDGMWLSKHVDTARQIAEKGHELGNHAYSHKNMSTLSRAQNETEIVKTEKLLKEQVGVSGGLFAPPSGDYNQTTVDAAHSLGLKTILWTLDTVDWKKPPADSIVRKVSARVEPGAMILMHPTASSSEALSGMIRSIRAKGLQLGTVSDILSPQRLAKVESPGQ
ncbi:probable sporulation protein, polysaccharide deacetylase family [Paenibacillus sp. UNCCL117]|uniref:polysaccharide deacetylase family protein n=1 Tax=unclassified Paenibacillus TaxID=185978 RepID=UPI0008859F21|nr:MULTISPECIES: polysaccharide deacetylase family protein [unclassified Paenibacillus]SDC87841.1 probable sporulation protein, polysaccharide deacetylase family [Paenibacillus sp. cl123]SFW28169.1 probable sporulation protein, polysaccharide deacetylase family [Paenibacillus sp. UNCCL117]